MKKMMMMIIYILICNTENNQIYKLYLNGTNELFAGIYGYKNGENEYESNFKRPNKIILTNEYNIFLIVDTKNNLIRRLNKTSHKISVFSGNGLYGYKNGKWNESSYRHPIDIVIDSFF